MTILVTGGAGFIGSAFLRYTRANHPADRLLCLDALTYAGRLETLAGLTQTPGFTFHRGDIRDRSCVEALFQAYVIDAVVNFAAETHVDRSVTGPEVFTQTNVLGTQTLLEACRRHGTRFHQVSTDEVYGDLPLTGGTPFTEDSPLRPSSPYAASKAAADLLALAYHRTYGLPVTISRCGNNYGPYQYPEKLIPRLLTLALANRPLPVYGDGKNVRDWIYVYDHCAAIDAIFRRGTPGEVYNVGVRGELDNLTLARRLLQTLGKPEHLLTFVADRPGHDRRYAIDPTKLEQALGWRGEMDFDQGLSETIQWYLTHRDWWEPLTEEDIT